MKFHPFFSINIIYNWPLSWLLKLERAEKLTEKFTLKRESELEVEPDQSLRESPNQPSEDSPEEEVSRESLSESTRKSETSSRNSSDLLSRMPSPTLSTLRERPSLPWTLSMLLRDKEELSTDSDSDLIKRPFITFLFNLLGFLVFIFIFS